MYIPFPHLLGNKQLKYSETTSSCRLLQMLARVARRKSQEYDLYSCCILSVYLPVDVHCALWLS